MENLIRIGRLNKTFGLKGHIRVFVEPEFFPRLKRPEVLFLASKNKSLPYFPDEIEFDETGHGMLHFEDVKDKTTADFLVGKEVYIEEKFLKRQKSIQSPADFIGFKLIDAGHGDLGVLDNFFELPQHDLGQFILKGKEVLFPWNQEVVLQIDKKKKVILLKLPDGLIDIYL